MGRCAKEGWNKGGLSLGEILKVCGPAEILSPHF